MGRDFRHTQMDEYVHKVSSAHILDLKVFTAPKIGVTRKEKLQEQVVDQSIGNVEVLSKVQARGKSMLDSQYVLEFQSLPNAGGE